MKFKIRYIFIFLLSLTLNSCGLFDMFSKTPYTSVFIILKNNSNSPDCGADSASVIFKVSNFNNRSPNELSTEVKPDNFQNINVTIKKGEYLLVRVINTQDSTLIIEKKYQAGEGPNTWNDPLPRTVTFCGKRELKFENF